MAIFTLGTGIGPREPGTQFVHTHSVEGHSRVARDTSGSSSAYRSSEVVEERTLVHELGVTS